MHVDALGGQKRGHEFPVARVTSSSELSYVGIGNQIWSSMTATTFLNQWAISSTTIFF